MKYVNMLLPFPPTVNTYWRHIVMGKRAATILSDAARKYRKAVCDAILEQHTPRGIFSGRLAVAIIACPPDRRARDLDNLPKGILDSLKHAGVIQDDSAIDQLTVMRSAIVKGGSVNVTVSEIQP